MNIFELKPEEGIRPTVTVLDSPGPFKDILVKVQETRTGSVKIGGVITTRGKWMLFAVVEERNFDPLHWPTSGMTFGRGGPFEEPARESAWYCCHSLFW